MQTSQKLLIYNQFNKSIFRAIRERSTVATTVCPYAVQTDSNDVELASVKNETTTKYLPYSQVPGPKPLPIIGNTWRSVAIKLVVM
jgi:hypothetical protein